LRGATEDEARALKGETKSNMVLFGRGDPWGVKVGAGKYPRR
jgi:hypothetical protein